MKKKMDSFYVNVLRVRNLETRMMSITSRILSGPKEFFQTHLLFFGFLYLPWYVLCILVGAPPRVGKKAKEVYTSWTFEVPIWTSIKNKLNSWLHQKKYSPIKS